MRRKNWLIVPGSKFKFCHLLKFNLDFFFRRDILLASRTPMTSLCRLDAENEKKILHNTVIMISFKKLQHLFWSAEDYIIMVRIFFSLCKCTLKRYCTDANHILFLHMGNGDRKPRAREFFNQDFKIPPQKKSHSPRGVHFYNKSRAVMEILREGHTALIVHSIRSRSGAATLISPASTLNIKVVARKPIAGVRAPL